jgi:SAM-dependent methyltransferase
MGYPNFGRRDADWGWGEGPSAPKPPLRLNICSGTDIRDGWCNIDAVAWPSARRPPDVYWKAGERLPFPDDSADEIYCGYVFLHVRPNLHDALLTDIRRCMKRGARLVVCEVAMEILLPRWLANPSDKYLSGLVWGELGDFHGDDLAQWDSHNQGFTEASLREFMVRGGFPNVRRFYPHASGVWYDLSLETFKGA